MCDFKKKFKMRLLPIFFVAAFATSGTAHEDAAPVHVARRFWTRWLGDEFHVERRGWSLRSMLRKAFKKMHLRVSNRYISSLMKKYNKKNLIQMIKSIQFGEE